MVSYTLKRHESSNPECLNPYCSGRWSRTLDAWGERRLTRQEGLNPYCSGRWSRTVHASSSVGLRSGLNPYCSGRWSRTAKHFNDHVSDYKVLILIVVEDGLVLHVEVSQWFALPTVLILIVVEDGLVLDSDGMTEAIVAVLILIVVEDGLVQCNEQFHYLRFRRLNPYCSGRWSRTRPYKTLLIINKLKSFSKQIFTFLNRKLTIS